MRKYKGFDFKFEQLAIELYRTLKTGGVGVWIVDDETKDGSESVTSAKQKIFFRESCGFNVHDTMVYAKNTALAVGDHSRYRQTFEYMFILSKGKPLKYNLIKDRKNKRAGEKTQFSGRGERKKYGQEWVIEEFSVRGHIWEYSTGFNISTSDTFVFGIHPAIFPEKLAEDHILSWSNPGDVVLDPMCGSGTTCKMAAKHGRKYVGIDIAEKYCEIARKRVALIEAQPLLFNEANVSLHCQFD